MHRFPLRLNLFYCGYLSLDRQHTTFLIFALRQILSKTFFVVFVKYPLLYKCTFFCRLAHIFKNFHHFFIKNRKENKKRRTPSNIKLFVVRHGIFFKPISKLYQTNQGSSPLRILHLRQTCLTYFYSIVNERQFLSVHLYIPFFNKSQTVVCIFFKFF